ncbi:DUF5133 domain-containing protein [Streptomyces sp. NBC_00083]|uniref:DUF5133 domain-containing protein n=1 Tax=Streptomyces sp. NBC_00083 TaxID=2975647 RepID=UPI002255D2DD|nr:DUF5133 domain-containing protein [Streptomyces sp. NBC_00083]MCX5384810.1 DUF5133 domain-containing protein [Streptomyces sp. NBC_00083]
MPEAHPKTLRILLTRYAEARIAHAYSQNPAAAREADDVAYTLCVATGTACVDDAIAAADLLLADPRRGGSVGARRDEADLAA